MCLRIRGNTKQSIDLLHSLLRRGHGVCLCGQGRCIFENVGSASCIQCIILLRALRSRKLTISQWLQVAEVFYILTMLVLKKSLALFFLRIMVKRWQQHVVYCAITLSTVMSIGYFFFACFQCGVSSDTRTYQSHVLIFPSTRELMHGSFSYAK